MPFHNPNLSPILLQLLKVVTFVFIFLIFTTHPAIASSLIGTSVAAPPSINLTTEGSADWAHWGLTSATTFNHKAGVAQQISNYTRLTNSPGRYQASAGVRVNYIWSGGTPTASASTTSGVYFSTTGNGFRLSVPASSITKILRLYVGAWYGRGQLQATLSDNSAAPYVTLVDNPSGVIDRVITLEFSSASPGQTLNIVYTLVNNYGFGNITLAAATLQEITNLPPTDLQLSATSVNENAANGTSIGTFSTVDPDSSETFTYSLINNAGGRFAIGGGTNNQLVVANSSLLNYEATTSHSITARTTDSAVHTFDKVFNITLNNVNEPPVITSTAILNAVQDIPYNYDVNATDPDTGDSLTYSLDTFPTGMLIDGVSGLISWTPTVSDIGNHSVTVRVTDSGLLFSTQSYTLTVSPTNTPPTDILLDNSSVNENAANGTVVGTLSTVDPDSGETFTYNLIDNADGRFAIGGAANDKVVVANGSLLNFEAAASHNITVHTQDSAFHAFDKALAITVNNVNEPPVFNQASYFFSVPENSNNGTAVGTVSAIDPDSGDILSYAILNDVDNVFAINTSAGTITVSNTTALNFEITPVFNLQVRVTDNLLLTHTVALTINLTNINEPPVQASIGNKSIIEGQLLSFTVTASDPDAGDIPVMTATTLPGTAAYTDNGNGTATFNWTPALGSAASSPYAVIFTATSSSALFDDEAISITVNPAPVGVLTGTNAAAPPSINLTTEGSADWAHWGLTSATTFNHKAGVAQQISNYTRLTNSPGRYQASAGVRVNYIWSGGTPTASASTTSGVYFSTTGNGFRLSVPASSITKILRLYVGAWYGRGQLQATLSDNSAAPYVTLVDNPSGVIDRVITLEFSSASPGQTLNIVYTLVNNYGFGNITLAAATLYIDPNANIPFIDDFTGGMGNWTIVDNSGIASSWSVAGGALQQLNRVENRPGAFDQSYHKGTYAYYNGGFSMTNYRFSVDATFLGSKLADDIGIMFRYQNNDNYYRLSMNSRYGFTRLEKKVAGIFTPLAVDSRGYGIGELLTFTINVSGSLIQVFVNGTPLFAVNDASLATGTVALYTQDKAVFDNVHINHIPTAPVLVLSAPTAYSVNNTNTINSSAIVLNAPSSSYVEFMLDGFNPTVVDTTPPYNALFTGVTQGNHTIEARLYDASNIILSQDSNPLLGRAGNHYLAIGDSITNGSGDRFSSDNILQDGLIISFQSYEANLTGLINNSLGYPNIVVNEGIGGDESADAAFIRINSILARNPDSDRALVMLGTNDSGSLIPSGLGCTGSACNGTFKGNMQSLINSLTNAGKQVWVALVPPAFSSSNGVPFTNPATAARNTTYIQTYNQVITTQLANRSVGPDFYNYFLGSGTNRFSLFNDTLHPNALGYVVMAHLWHNVLNQGAPIPLPFVLENLVPSTVAPYLKQTLIESGDSYYVDAPTLTITGSIPAELTDGRWIMTANASKSNTTANYVSFNVDRAVTVYIAYDADATTLPAWMSSYNNTGLTIDTTDPLSPMLNLYSMSFGAGSVILGGNLQSPASGADSNYIAIVVEN